MLVSSPVEPPQDKRLRISWSKRTVPLKNSALFNKVKHSQEWHENVEGTAGVLKPGDPKFPYAFLRNHTDAYLRKKGKSNQADTDIRLSILIDAHNVRYLAVAAAAHAISAKSLRALLSVETNIAPVSFWGLDIWLQCLIAANQGNPAAVTDTEAAWARMILPYTEQEQGLSTPASYLRGVGKILRISQLPSLNALPDFSELIRQAITNYALELEGYRLKSQWLQAQKATFWLSEFDTPLLRSNSQSYMCLESILDTRLPAWRYWACWRPNFERITYLTSTTTATSAILMDFLSLDGPDTITGKAGTLKDGLIAHYEGSRPWIKYRKLVIEVPERTKGSLDTMLARLLHGVEVIKRVVAEGRDETSLLQFWSDLVVTTPVTDKGLRLFEATFDLDISEIEVYDIIRFATSGGHDLGGLHIAPLTWLLITLEDTRAQKLAQLINRDRFLEAIKTCLKDCQEAVRQQMNTRNIWMPLALELHAFCMSVVESKYVFAITDRNPLHVLNSIPSREQMKRLAEIYLAIQRYSRPTRPALKTKDGSLLSSSPSNKTSEDTQDTESARHPSEEAIENFCRHRLVDLRPASKKGTQIVNIVCELWKNTSQPQVDVDRRTLAIIIPKITALEEDLQIRCLAELACKKELEPPKFVQNLLNIVVLAQANLPLAIISLTKLLSGEKSWTQCWKDLLYVYMVQANTEEIDALDFSLQNMKAAEWLLFMNSLDRLFEDKQLPSVGGNSTPTLLQPRLLGWVTQVSIYTRTITRLEAALEDHKVVRLLLSCKLGLWTKNAMSILLSLERAEGKPVESLMQKITGEISVVEENAWEVRDCLVDLLQASPEAVQFCYRVWDAKHGSMEIQGLSKSGIDAQLGSLGSPGKTDATGSQTQIADKERRSVTQAVAEVMVAGWVQDENICSKDRMAVTWVAKVLKLEVYEANIPQEKLQEATSFYAAIEAEILKEAERLDNVKKALKAVDPKGTAALLQEIGMPDSSPLEEEISALPSHIIDLVEQVGDCEIEMSFSLSAYSELQRTAMGVPASAQSLLLRLSVDHSATKPPSFCLHYNNQTHVESLVHTPWMCARDSKSPQGQVCISTQTAFVWQMNRRVHTQLHIGNVRILDVYNFMKKNIEEMSHACVSCGTSHNAHNARLRRSTPCDVLACAQLWYTLPLDIRIPELRTDTFAIDLLLTSIYAAASSSRPELLPSCPIPNTSTVKTILNALPTLTVLSHAVHLSSVLATYHVQAETLLSWACTYYRGYLITAQHKLLRIPNLPIGTHQFILANASPRLESQFTTRLAASTSSAPSWPLPKTKQSEESTILFHGTCLSRLPQILAQGLLPLSSTPLQRTGAVHGPGIYLAEEPSTSYAYAMTHLSWRNSGLSNMRLMLGCEVVGGGRSVAGDVHVLTEEKDVSIRYVFLFPNTVGQVPLARHVVPAMRSGIKALRGGVI